MIPNGKATAFAACLRAQHSLTGLFATAFHRYQSAHFAQPKRRHATVDRFIISRLDHVSLMPDADIAAAVLQAPVEIDPGWPMQSVAASRIGFQLIVGPPVLDDDLHC